MEGFLKEIFPHLNMIHGILLDLDNTMFSFSDAEKKALKETYNVYKQVFPISEREFMKRFFSVRNSCEDCSSVARHDRLLMFQKMVEEAVGTTHFSFVIELHDTYWATLYAHAKLYPGVLKTLQWFKEKGLSVCLVTDQIAVYQMQKIAALGVEHFIDHIVTSEEVNQNKPGRKPFVKGLSKLELSKKDVVMIGDNYDRDIVGANKIGIKTICFRGHGKCSDFSAKNWTDVKKAVEKLLK
jgi:FMN phosphatase YigB (HAD superfamily)